MQWLALFSHLVFAGVDCGPGVAVGFAALFGLALVPVLFAFGNGQFALYPPISEVKAGGNERMSLDLRLCHEPTNFFLVHQQLSGAGFVVVSDISVGIGTDMQVEQKSFPVLDEAIGVLEIRFPFANGFDFGSTEGHAGLEFFKEKVVVAGDTVVGGVALAGGNGSRGTAFFSGPVRSGGTIVWLVWRGIGEIPLDFYRSIATEVFHSACPTLSPGEVKTSEYCNLDSALNPHIAVGLC